MKKIKKQKIKHYSNKKELDVVLNYHRNNLYTFVSRLNKEDKIICDWISIRLVRLSQKGNILAKKKIISLLGDLVDQWIEYDRSLSSWKGYNDLKIKYIEVCIRRFRYAGSFLGYLHRTLQYAGLGLVPIEKFSLDDYLLNTQKRKVDTFNGEKEPII